MNYIKSCCVPSCLNTTELTKNSVVYFRFPINEKIKQNWLKAINWPDGKPECNDFVCSRHFETQDLPAINEYTTIVPTIFNPEVVGIEIESNSFVGNISTTNREAILDTEFIKVENHSIDENDDCDFKPYETIDPLKTNCQFDIIEPEEKRNKLDVSNPTVPVAEAETQIQKLSRIWQDDETREFLLCISKHRDEFLSTRTRKFKKIALYLEQLNVLNQPATEKDLYYKWKDLLKKCKIMPTIGVNGLDFPFKKEMATILLDAMESNQYSISIGLDSSFQADNRNNTKSWIRDDTIKDLETKNALLQKIEVRETKNKLLRKLLIEWEEKRGT